MSAVHKGLISVRNNYLVGLVVSGAILASRWVVVDTAELSERVVMSQAVMIGNRTNGSSLQVYM